VEQGWEWLVISSQVEEAIPRLPTFLQMALNASNSIRKATNELETAMLMTSQFQAGVQLHEAIAAAKEGDHKCRESIPAIGHYVQRYAGGPTFPLIQFLAKFGSTFGATLLLGQEFMSTLAHLDFKHPTNVFPFLRAAVWATMLTSSKATDGFAKVLVKGDLEKLKGQSMAKSVLEAEGMLQDAWEVIQSRMSQDAKAESHLHKCYGLLCIRTVLFLTGKQKLSREPSKKFEDIQQILENFTSELQGVPAQEIQNTKSESVADVVNAAPSAVALLQNSHMRLHEV
jgi:hypothetical protein